MSKKIAYIVSNPGVNDARVIKMAKASAKKGYKVYLFGVYKPGFEYYEEIENMKIFRFEWKPLNLLLENSFFLPVINKINKKLFVYFGKKILPYKKYNLFSKIIIEEILKIKPDLIHAHDLICLPVAARAAKELNIPYIYDAHELEIHRNPPLPFFQKNYVKFIEKKYAKDASVVITVGKYVAKELSKHLPNKKIEVIYNSPDIEKTRHKLHNDLNIVDKKVILYVGKVAMGRGIEDVIKILPNLSNDIVFATVGPVDKRQKELLEKLADNLNVSDRFTILPPVKYNQVVEYIKGADLGLISVQPVTLSYQYSMPNKLFELSFANVPILSNDLDEIKEFIQEHGNGEVIDINDSVKLKFYISKMLKLKEKYLMNNETYQKLYNKYSWEAQLKNLFNIYNDLISSKNN